MSKGEKAILRVVIATGISSVVTQLVMIREFLALFQGNEYVIAIILFSWLILGGIGTLGARRLSSFWRPTVYKLAWLSLFLAVIPVVQLLAARLLRDEFFIHGASVGFYQTCGYIFLVIAPYGLLLGFVLPFSLFVLRTQNAEFPGARIYMADNLGDVAGGALFSFGLIYVCSPIQAIALAGLPLLGMIICLEVGRRQLLLILVGVGGGLALLAGALGLENRSLTPVEGSLLSYQESRHGRIEVRRDHEQLTLFVDGVPLFSNQNRSAAEEIIHYPLAQVNNPRHVLLISAASGVLAEIDKYGLESVDYVELDPVMSATLFKFGFLQRIKGLKLINQDGLAFLRDNNKKYDAIIMSLPEPDTYQVNRFFTGRFFRLVRQRLAPGGIFSFSVQGFDNYLAEPQRHKISTIYNTARRYFENLLVLPGERIFFLGTNGNLTVDIPTRLAAKGITTSFVSRYYDGNITVDRINSLRDLIDPNEQVNTDFAPHLMTIMFWQWFDRFSTSPVWFLAGVTLLLGIYVMRLARVEFVLFSTGFATMGSEILVIFAFQIFYGYIYFMVGMIVTVFLAGLLPGAWLGERYRQRAAKLLPMLDIFLVGLLLIFVTALFFVGDRLPATIFLFFGFLVSLACGCQFPMALYLRGGSNQAAGGVFSADLMGAAGGTLVTSVILLPFLGLGWTAAGLIILKVTSFLLMRGRDEKT